MFKKIKVFALILSAAGAVALPKAASAQDGYYAPRGYGYYQSDRNLNRHEAREWREHERREWRAEERQERRWHRDWRDHDYDRWRDSYRQDYRPNFYFDYGYRR